MFAKTTTEEINSKLVNKTIPVSKNKKASCGVRTAHRDYEKLGRYYYYIKLNIEEMLLQ